MRLLLLTPRVPWPPTDGGRIAMSRLAESLARGGAAVEILSLNPRKHRVTDVAAPVPLRAIDIDTSRRLAPAFGALTHRAPYIVERFVSAAFREALRETLRRMKPDLVQIESPFLLPYLPVIREESGAPVVLRSLNVEFRIWELLARNEPRALKRIALRRVAASLRDYEVRHLDATDAIVPISRADEDDFRRLGCTKPMHVAPCGVQLDDLAQEPPEPWTAGFIGSLDFRPNQEAVEWIADELWPRVIAHAPQARLSIVGSSPPDWLRKRAAGQSIDFLGYVEDAEALVRRMSVIVAPLFAGGGMRIKVLEAMALAKPVVATRLGAGGIDVTDGHDIVLAEDPASFAGGVVRLLREPELAARIGTAARRTVATRYDSDTIARELLAFYESL